MKIYQGLQIPCKTVADSQELAEDAILEIECDNYAEDPREWENVCKMICWHGRYQIGDKNKYATPDSFLKAVGAKVNGDVITWPENIVAKPIYMMDHSEVSISLTDFGDKWDSGQIGWIYTTKAAVKKNFGADNWKENAEKAIAAEMKIENDYISGNVFCYHLIVNGVLSSGCGGFYGSTLEKTGILEDADVVLA